MQGLVRAELPDGVFRHGRTQGRLGSRSGR
jgi:hypothetical protein